MKLGGAAQRSKISAEIAKPLGAPPFSLGEHHFVTKADGGIAPMFDYTASQGKSSFVIAAKAANITSPGGSANVDWLKLTKVSGTVGDVVLRLDTRAGQPPAGPCTPGSAIVTSPYVAMYCWCFFLPSSLSMLMHLAFLRDSDKEGLKTICHEHQDKDSALCRPRRVQLTVIAPSGRGAIPPLAECVEHPDSTLQYTCTSSPFALYCPGLHVYWLGLGIGLMRTLWNFIGLNVCCCVVRQEFDLGDVFLRAAFYLNEQCALLQWEHLSNRYIADIKP